MVKKEFVIIVTIISILLVSGCDVYNTLYVKQPAMEGSDSDVISDADIMTEEDFTEMEEDAESVDAEVVTEEDVVTEEIDVSIPVEEETTDSTDTSTLSEDATVIIVEETEAVSLQPQAEDPDNDELLFTYTNPLDEDGEWQTSYGDAGEYTVTVTASDGTLSASKQALIIIKRKEEAPVIDSVTPVATALELEETEELEFAIIASDLNNDDLTYLWKLDGVDVSDSDSYLYETTYEDAGSHTIKVTVTDGLSDAEQLWSVDVANVNRRPVLEVLDDVDAKETDVIVLELEAFDEDGDALAFAIDDPRFEQDQNVFTWETTFDDSGEHLITVTVDDGEDTTEQSIIVSLENVNRAPVILDIIQKS